MGKLHSKLAPKRRQSPEGGILTSIHTPRERPTENLLRELKETSPHKCDLKVTLTPRGSVYGNHPPEDKQSKKRQSYTVDTEDSRHAEGPKQEWVFTLYNFDHSSKAIKEDMSNLIHSMYEAVEASVKQPSGGTTVLKFKLVAVSPSLQHKVSQTEKEQSAFQETGSSKRRLYCADENIERRNHYLDLAGVENYTSKFDPEEPPSQNLRHGPLSAPQHHLVLTGETCSSSDHPGGSSLFHPTKGKSSDKEGRSTRFHGQHPASWCQPSHPKHPVYSTAQRSHSKRLRSREQETLSPGLHTQPTKRHPTCGSSAPLALRHDHLHHHEHHHHHHHHHYHPA